MILLMCELGAVTFCVFTILFVWIGTSLSEVPWLPLTLSACPCYKDRLGARRCRWQCRKLTLSTVLLMHKPQMTWCHWYFTNQRGSHELLIESFQEWQVSFISHSPHSSRCRMQWDNVFEVSSCSRCFLALLVHLWSGSLKWSFSGGCSPQQFLFSAGSPACAAEITKGRYCWVSGHVRRGHWSWWRERFPFSFSRLLQSRCLGKFEHWEGASLWWVQPSLLFFLSLLFSNMFTLSLVYIFSLPVPVEWMSEQTVWHASIYWERWQTRTEALGSLDRCRALFLYVSQH